MIIESKVFTNDIGHELLFTSITVGIKNLDNYKDRFTLFIKQ